jgi:hypothetical protein
VPNRIRDALLQAVKSNDAALGRRDTHEQRYQMDFAFG